MPIASVTELLSVLGMYHQLGAEQLHALARESLPASVRAVGRMLVQRGWLTPYQINEWLLGRGPQLLLGSYVLLERLGEGGMGQVFKARNWKLGHIVALKLIRKERLTNGTAIKRFHREILAAAQLNHPHIVRAFDAGEVDGAHFFVMEFVDGIDLNRLVKSKGALTVDRACDYIRQAALGLQHAYERGLVHRDIKPHNLLLAKSDADDKELIKILDMGLARIDAETVCDDSSTMTQVGTVMGTPDYIAPEQGIDAHAVDIRADLYSLGCTLYFLIAGKTPFTGSTFVEKLIRHQQDRATPLGQLRGDVPALVDALVEKLMAKRPEDRFQTPRELAEALKAIQTGRAADIFIRPPRTLTPAAVPPANEFAQFAEAAAQTPVVIRPKTVTGPANNRTLRLGLVAASGVVGLILLIVSLRAFFGRPLQVPEREIPHTKIKTPLELAAEEKRKLLEEEKKRLIAEAEFQKKRQAAATGPLTELLRKVEQQKITFVELAREVQDFKARHGGTPAAIVAAEMLMKLPSPLDRLDSGRVPEDAKALWKAVGFDGHDVVAVLGEHRRRHWGPVRANAFAPDGRTVISLGTDQICRTWDTKTGAEHLLSLKPVVNPSLRDVVSPDGKWIAIAGQGGLFEAATGKEHPLKEATPPHSPFWASYGFSSDGTTLVGVDYGTSSEANFKNKTTIRSWDLATGKKKHEFLIPIGWQSFHPVAVLRDGQTIFLSLVASRKDNANNMAVKRIDLGTRTEQVLTTENATFLALSPDEQTLALVGGNIILWDIKQNKERLHFPGAAPVAFSPDNELLATGDGKLVEVATGKIRTTIPANGIPAFSPDGKQLIIGGADGVIRLWDVTTGKEEQPLTESLRPVSCVAFSPDEMSLASGDDDGITWLWRLDGSDNQPFQLKKHTHAIGGLAFGTDGKTLATGGREGTVRLWDLKGTQPAERASWQQASFGLVFSPDRAMLASHQIDGDARAYLMRLKDGLPTEKTPQNITLGSNVYAVAFSPDSRMMATGILDKQVHFWDLTEAAPVSRGKLELDQRIAAVAFSPASKIVAAATGQAVEFWDLSVAPPKQIAKTVISVLQDGLAYCADGKWLAVAGPKGVTLVDAASGARLEDWILPGPVRGIAFAADGRHLATANANGTVYILRIPPPPSVLTAEEAKKEQAGMAQKLGVPVQIKNNIGMKLNLIPAGRFVMGSTENDPERQPNESPHHTVTIGTSFYFGTCEVTVGQFKAFVKDTAYETQAETNGKGAWRLQNGQNVRDPKANWRAPGYEQGDDHPVVCVSWNDANAFCAWLSKKEGKKYRLPTEAEWEYACRAGTQTPYFFGKDSGPLDRYAWSGRSADGMSHATGKLLPNPWGLYDILGNVWEWCQDGPSSFTSSSVVDPRAPESQGQRVTRGASFHPGDRWTYYRSAFRFPPLNQDDGHANQGFRVVCEVNSK